MHAVKKVAALMAERAHLPDEPDVRPATEAEHHP